MLNLVFLGAPGAGKGTQATQIAVKYNIPQISTGDIFRDNIKRGTKIGLEAKSYIDKGFLVPDDVTIQIVKDRLSRADCKNGYILDGFPRNIYQAQKLDEFQEITKVINIDVPLDKLTRRITGRRNCPKCGAGYHIDFLGEDKIHCPKCGEVLVQRADDNEETVASRLTVYTNSTKPLIDYYSRKDILVNINGDKEVEKVYNDICMNLDL